MEEVQCQKSYLSRSCGSSVALHSQSPNPSTPSSTIVSITTTSDRSAVIALLWSLLFPKEGFVVLDNAEPIIDPPAGLHLHIHVSLVYGKYDAPATTTRRGTDPCSIQPLTTLHLVLALSQVLAPRTPMDVAITFVFSDLLPSPL